MACVFEQFAILIFSIMYFLFLFEEFAILTFLITYLIFRLAHLAYRPAQLVACHSSPSCQLSMSLSEFGDEISKHDRLCKWCLQSRATPQELDRSKSTHPLICWRRRDGRECSLCVETLDAEEEHKSLVKADLVAIMKDEDRSNGGEPGPTRSRYLQKRAARVESKNLQHAQGAILHPGTAC